MIWPIEPAENKFHSSLSLLPDDARNQRGSRTALAKKGVAPSPKQHGTKHEGQNNCGSRKGQPKEEAASWQQQERGRQTCHVKNSNGPKHKARVINKTARNLGRPFSIGAYTYDSCRLGRMKKCVGRLSHT